MWFRRNWLSTSMLAFAFVLGGCQQGPTTSDILVTDVDHTSVKRQSIGNCWIYAQSTWLESLIKTHSGEDVNVSESYWTYWHWHDQIVGSYISEVQTGGWWYESNRILERHGWVLESEFVEVEDELEMSASQAAALAYINTQLAEGGSLERREDRTPENVRRELNIGFGAEIEVAEAVARSMDDTYVGENITVRDALYGSEETRWNQVSFPRVYGEDALPSESQQLVRDELMVRVRRALNDRQPVVMTMMIDFNALDVNDQTFKAETLRAAGFMGTQGGHMVVLSDYTVNNAPGFGYIGEGVVTDEMKEAALAGDIVLLKAKNSWGTNRPDRGLTDGFTRFDWEYLTSTLAWRWGDTDESSFYTTLTNFVLPPGY